MKGTGLIKSHLANTPDLPGIYRMLDIGRNVIYIGKSKNIRNRLSQYTLELTGKNKIMISLVYHLEYTITESESAALLLESQLIKKYKPKFNILLKDDKSFPFIKLRLDHDYPQLLKYRGRNLNDGKIFGPFASSKHVDTTLTELQKIFKLRSCTDGYFVNRNRPCLQYQIKRCIAPCVGKVLKKEYDDLVLEVKAFLSGSTKKLQKILSQKMEKFSNKLKFEKAAEIRDKIKSLSYIQIKSDSIQHLQNADVVALANHNGEFCIQLFIYRSYQSCGNQAYFPKHINFDESSSEVLGAFIMQFYQNKTPPKQILISHRLDNIDVYTKALKNLHGITVEMYIPKLGNKGKLMKNAIHNAQLALQKHLKISAKNSNALMAVQKLFVLAKIPKRIEVYDNSHIQGAFPVGAMIVAGIDGFEKKNYRLFNIKNKTQNPFGGDDYDMLREVLTRRLKRLKFEPLRAPDLMIIDGGKGHMKIVTEVMKKVDTHIPFVCMSKGIDRNSGREQFHRVGQDLFTLDKNLSVMKYLQILRDEAHNFAIKGHRKKHSNAIKNSSLDHIPGIGELRKKALLNYFGSFKMITDATVKDLTKVDGINKNLAKIIFESLD